MNWIKVSFLVLVFCVVKHNAKAQTDTLFIEPWNNGHAVYLLPAGAKLPSALINDNQNNPKISNYRKFKTNFPHRFVPAYSYKGEWLMYDPCDGIFEFQSGLSDSTWINYYFDDPWTMPLEAIEEQDDHHIEFRALYYDWEDPTMSIEHSIRIDRDTLPGLYFVTFTNLVTRVTLTNAYIDFDEAHRFRYLVNHCTYRKELEFAGFDE